MKRHLVDQSGHLLTQSNTSGRDLNDAQLKFANDVESRIQRRIEAILSPIVGNGNVHAQVTAQLDFANKEQTEEHYSPNGDASKATLRSRQLNISEQVGAGYPGGVPARCRTNQRRLTRRRSPRRRPINKTRRIRHKPAPVPTVTVLARVVHSVMKPVTTKWTAPFVTPK